MRANSDNSMRPPFAAGFSLVELLTAMAIMMLLIAVLSAILSDTENAWTRGTSESDVLTAGRTALGLISADLGAAIADENLAFITRPDRDFIASYGVENDEMCFVRLGLGGSGTNRAAQMVRYRVRGAGETTNSYELVRDAYSISDIYSTNAADNCYWNEDWFELDRTDPPGIVAERVAAFYVSVPGNSEYDSRDHDNCLPEYADIFLELADEEAADRAADLTARGLDCSEMIERSVRRFTARVYFNNRTGYNP